MTSRQSLPLSLLLIALLVVGVALILGSILFILRSPVRARTETLVPEDVPAINPYVLPARTVTRIAVPDDPTATPPPSDLPGPYPAPTYTPAGRAVTRIAVPEEVTGVHGCADDGADRFAQAQERGHVVHQVQRM